jgi:hypothetical protein
VTDHDPRLAERAEAGRTLFFVGWLGILLGLGLMVDGARGMSGGGLPATLVTGVILVVVGAVLLFFGQGMTEQKRPPRRR